MRPAKKDSIQYLDELPMKILVISGRYGVSGVPLAQLRLANVLSKRGHEVIYVVGAINDNLTIKNVKFSINNLDCKRVIQMPFKLAFLFSRFKPDLIFTAGDHLNVVVLFAAIISLCGAKISCSSRVTPFDTYAGGIFSKNWFLKIAMILLSWRANVMTCVSQEMVGQYREVFKRSKHICIYNIVIDDSFEQRKSLEPIDWPILDSGAAVIIGAGNLESWKGFSDLINAFHIVRSAGNAKLIILGDGSLKYILENEILRLGLDKDVFLMGNKKNPYQYFRKSDVFVLSSYVEGMPNVLIEAIACGCTIVSTDCKTGPAEIISDGVNGYLTQVGNIEMMANKINQAILAPIPYSASTGILEKFKEEDVFRKHYESLGISL